MKRNRYLLLLLGVLVAGLLLCCPSLSKGAIIIPLLYPCHGRMPSSGDLEDIVQAQMLLSQRTGLQEPYSGYYKTYVDYITVAQSLWTASLSSM